MPILTREQIEQDLKNPHSLIKTIIAGVASLLYNQELLIKLITEKNWLDSLIEKLVSKKIDYSNSNSNNNNQENINNNNSEASLLNTTPIQNQIRPIIDQTFSEILINSLNINKIKQLAQYQAVINTAVSNNPSLKSFVDIIQPRLQFTLDDLDKINPDLFTKVLLVRKLFGDNKIDTSHTFYIQFESFNKTTKLFEMISSHLRENDKLKQDIKKCQMHESRNNSYQSPSPFNNMMNPKLVK